MSSKLEDDGRSGEELRVGGDEGIVSEEGALEKHAAMSDIGTSYGSEERLKEGRKRRGVREFGEHKHVCEEFMGDSMYILYFPKMEIITL